VLRRKPHVLYIRHFLTGPLFILFLSCVKLVSRNTSILSEVPTYPYDDIAEFKASLTSRVMLFQDKLYRRLLRYFYDRIVSIGYADDIFGIKTISISNGIDVSHYETGTRRGKPLDALRIIGVGYLKDYHGYDRLVDAVKRSLSAGADVPPIELHIVSPETAALAALRAQAETAGIASNVIFHGEKTGSQLDRLFDQCDLAAGSLAWHRVHVQRHSNLKTREYMARGIPFLYAGIDEQLPDDFRYAVRVPLEDAPIRLELLLDFAKDVLSDQNHSVAMRAFARDHMSWRAALTPVVEYLKLEHRCE
jgi:glycosyltransferase involved in cell wall biosynthesis